MCLEGDARAGYSNMEKEYIGGIAITVRRDIGRQVSKGSTVMIFNLYFTRNVRVTSSTFAIGGHERRDSLAL